jgi:hypothetical protein
MARLLPALNDERETPIQTAGPKIFEPVCRESTYSFVFKEDGRRMLYALLCYNSEEVVASWTKQEDQAVMAKLAVVNDRLIREKKMGPVARLMPTTAATTLRKSGKNRRLEAGDEPSLVLDGPFAETKEQLLGFFVVDCASLDDALAIARELGEANPGGAYEVRPIAFYQPGASLT